MLVLSGYASVFNNQDSANEIVTHIAFAKTLDDYNLRDKRIPVLWSHQDDTIIGYVSTITQDKKGLFAKLTMFEDHPKVQDIKRCIEHKIQFGLSISYEKRSQLLEDEIIHLTELALIEISICLKPCNKLAIVETMEYTKDA